MSKPSDSTNHETPTLIVGSMQLSTEQCKVTAHLENQSGRTGDCVSVAPALAVAEHGTAIAPTPAPSAETP